MPSDFEIKINSVGVEQSVKARLMNQMERIKDRSVQMAKELSPVRTGKNRDSITGKLIFGKGDMPGFSMSTHSGYGGYLEIGTSAMAAQPYMVPAVEAAFSEEGEALPW